MTASPLCGSWPCAILIFMFLTLQAGWNLCVYARPEIALLSIELNTLCVDLKLSVIIDRRGGQAGRAPIPPFLERRAVAAVSCDWTRVFPCYFGTPNRRNLVLYNICNNREMRGKKPTAQNNPPHYPRSCILFIICITRIIIDRTQILINIVSLSRIPSVWPHRRGDKVRNLRRHC